VNDLTSPHEDDRKSYRAYFTMSDNQVRPQLGHGADSCGCAVARSHRPPNMRVQRTLVGFASSLAADARAVRRHSDRKLDGQHG
jgi:hypothetical protein